MRNGRYGAQRQDILKADEMILVEMRATTAGTNHMRDRNPGLGFARELRIAGSTIRMVPQYPVLNAILEQIRCQRRLKRTTLVPMDVSEHVLSIRHSAVLDAPSLVLIIHFISLWGAPRILSSFITRRLIHSMYLQFFPGVWSVQHTPSCHGTTPTIAVGNGKAMSPAENCVRCKYSSGQHTYSAPPCCSSPSCLCPWMLAGNGKVESTLTMPLRAEPAHAERSVQLPRVAHERATRDSRSRQNLARTRGHEQEMLQFILVSFVTDLSQPICVPHVGRTRHATLTRFLTGAR